MTSEWNAKDHSKVSLGRVLVVGCGYLGTRVAQMAVELGASVSATTRRPERAKALAAQGIDPYLADWTDARTLRRLPDADHVLVAVSYDPVAGHDRETAIVGGLRHLIRRLYPPSTAGPPSTANPSPVDVRRQSPVDLCYVSTTGVYHQGDGRWVDETSPTKPSRPGGVAHLRAEQLLHRLIPSQPWTILRLAGIYGPGRVPRVADVIAGRPIATDPMGFLNLIHVSDAARAVIAAWQRGVSARDECPPDRRLSALDEMPARQRDEPRRQRLYVVADDRPVIRGEFYREISRICDAPPPRFTEINADSPGQRRAESNKRIWNRRIRRDLLKTLRFPSYREGLRDVLTHVNRAPEEKPGVNR